MSTSIFCCLQEEMKTLDRELARAKVSANRVAVVVANEWKDGNDKVMPVKQWLEERRILQVSNKCLISSSLILWSTCSQLVPRQSLMEHCTLSEVNYVAFC
jgi:hypothetical protein